MHELWKSLFASAPFIPHGHCYLWKPGLVWLHILSDSLIALAYYSIPLMLVYFVRKRTDVPFSWIFPMFAAFIVACGTTHVMEIWTLWHPIYWLSGLLKAITAFISVCTAVELVPLIPQALALPSPAQLEAANQELHKQISVRQQAELALLQAHDELELRVRERTINLQAANKQLQEEIAERQLLQEALQKYKDLFEFAELGVAVGAADGSVLEWLNPAFARMHGFTVEELTGTPILDLYPPEHAAKIPELVQLANLTGHIAFETVHFRKDGFTFPVRVELTAVKDAFGKVLYRIATNSDITERHEAEEALRQSEERYRFLMLASTQIIWTNSADGRMTGEQPSWSAFTGQTYEEYQNYGWSAAVHPDDVEHTLASWNRAVLHQSLCEMEHRVLSYDGEYKHFSVRAAPVFNADGSIREWVGAHTDITERKEAESKLRESEERMRLAVESTGLGTWDYNPITGSLQWSDRCKAVFGLPPEASVNYDVFLSRLHPEDRERTDKIVQRVLDPNGNGEYNIEYRTLWPDGTVRWAVAMGRAFFNENKQAYRFIGTILDITERQQALEALHRSEQRYRFLADAMAQIVWTSRPDGYLDYYNKRWYEFTGFVEGGGGDNSWTPILHPDDVELCLNLWYGAVRTGEPYEIEYRFFDRKTGNYRWHLGRALPMKNQDGEIVQWVGTCTDIDDQKRTLEALARAHDELELKVQERTAELQQEIVERQQTEELLRQSDKRFRYLVEHAVDGFFVHDRSGRVLDVNQGACNSLGYTREELLTLFVQDFEENFYSQRVAQSWQQMVPGIPIMVNGVHRRKDGTTFPVDVRVGLFELGDRQLMHALVRDVTKQKQVEQELRTAKESAQAANSAKSEFLATMSHEIRTPMNAVIGMTGLLLDTELTPQQREFAETIRTSGDALLTIINDILDFSKIESGKLELESKPFELRTCIESALELNAAKATEKHLELVYLVAPLTPNVFKGDVTRLRQILVNLVSNAVKFTEAGEVVVSVTAQQVRGEELEIQVAIKDTGIGIAPERMDRLFKSFSQVDSSTSRQYGGTGLGLAISKRLAEMMGGKMWVESQVGVGSTFYFTVVAQLATNPTADSRSASQVGACWKTISHLAGKRLLIVDDNATSRQMLTLQGQYWEMIPCVAKSACEALDWINSGERFDIALVDMQMPEMDGLALAAEIRKQLNAQQLPLVMLTERGHSETVARASDLELTAFLNKPLKQSQLYDALSSILSGQMFTIKQSCPTPTQIDPHLAQRLPLRILLAEDHLVNQKMALLILQRMGYRADVAGNGLEVLQALRRQPYDVVLMDMQMPHMDGLEATCRICQEWPHSVRPWIIAMTANAMLGDREQCLEAGMDDYISKPIRVEELIRVLGKCKPKRNDFDDLMRDENSSSKAKGQYLSDTADNSLDPESLLPNPAIETKVLQEFRDMAADEQILAQMVDCYFEESAKLLQAMGHAAALGDGAALMRAAHMLKSSSASLGAINLSNLCKELEVMGRGGTTQEASEILLQLEAEYYSVQAALLIERQRGQP